MRHCLCGSLRVSSQIRIIFMIRKGFHIQKSTVIALFLREIKTRFGKYRLGYCWALLEPVLHLFVLWVVFDYVMQRAMPDISFPVFLLNGLIPYFLFSNIATRSINAFEANQGLFNYRPVKPVDTIIARAVLETFIYTIVYFLLMALLLLSGEAIDKINLIELCTVGFLLIVFSFGLGLIVMVVGNAFPEMEKFLPVIIKPLYFISCIMFPLNSVPEEYWGWLLWNPLLHVVELARESLAINYQSEGASLAYLAFSTLVVLFVGLLIYRSREEAMLTS